MTPTIHKQKPRRRRPKLSSSGGGKVPAPYNDADHGERLQKVLATAGVASRRDCEEMILQGRVTINHQRINALPAWADAADDRIEIDGVAIARPSKRGGKHVQHVYVMLNKPRNTITTTDDPHQRRTVLDLVEQQGLTQGQRLFPVGRLDADSTGLILLTNDGELANRLTHPRYGVTKRYHVAVKGSVGHGDLQRLEKGLYLASRGRGTGASKGRGTSTPPGARKAAMDHVKIIGSQRDQSRGDRTLLEVTLSEGQNREIRRMLSQLGFNVRRLRRIALGRLTLGKLPSGQGRDLTGHEVDGLRHMVGL